jgi:hypothetical protein
VNSTGKSFCPRYKHTQANKNNTIEWAESDMGKAWSKAHRDSPEVFTEGPVVHGHLMLDGSPHVPPITVKAGKSPEKKPKGPKDSPKKARFG